MYAHAQLGDLIDLDAGMILPVIHQRLDLYPSAGQAGRRKLMRLLAKRALVFAELQSHGLGAHAVEILAQHGQEVAYSTPAALAATYVSRPDLTAP